MTGESSELGLELILLAGTEYVWIGKGIYASKAYTLTFKLGWRDIGPRPATSSDCSPRRSRRTGAIPFLIIQPVWSLGVVFSKRKGDKWYGK